MKKQHKTIIIKKADLVAKMAAFKKSSGECFQNQVYSALEQKFKTEKTGIKGWKKNLI